MGTFVDKTFEHCPLRDNLYSIPEFMHNFYICDRFVLSKVYVVCCKYVETHSNVFIFTQKAFKKRFTADAMESNPLLLIFSRVHITHLTNYKVNDCFQHIHF